MESLCRKVVAESEKVAGAAYTALAEKKTLEDCLEASKKSDKDPKAKEAAAVFVKTIFTACKDKSGAEWLQRYGLESPNAAKNAAEKVQ
ncbi:MAG: hypothetical protein WCX65_19315 [bacterium]